MVKVKSPLFSLDASGTFAKDFNYSVCRGRHYFRQNRIGGDSPSIAQIQAQTMMAFLIPQWRSFSDATHSTWASPAEAGNFSSFNAYVQTNMLRWVARQTPGPVFPVVDLGYTAAIQGFWLTRSGSDITLIVQRWATNVPWGYLIHRSLGWPFPRNDSHLIHIWRPTPASFNYWTDYNLSPGTYYYILFGFTTDGKVAVNSTVAWLTVP